MKFIDVLNPQGVPDRIPVLAETEQGGFNSGFVLGLLWGGLKAYEEMKIPEATYAVDPRLEDQMLLILSRSGWYVTNRKMMKGLLHIEAEKKYADDYGMQC
jgi:hypothetical protein